MENGEKTEHSAAEKCMVEMIRRFRRLTAEQKIRATMMNNRATRRLVELGARELRRPD